MSESDEEQMMSALASSQGDGDVDASMPPAASVSFTLLGDKPLQAAVIVASWCPTMDLLALATADSHVSCLRLNWQRLWSSQVKVAVTALAFSPDGKQLAVGCEDGCVLVFGVESGGHLFAGELGDCPVQTLSWVAEDGDACPRVVDCLWSEPASNALISKGPVPTKQALAEGAAKPSPVKQSSPGVPQALALLVVGYSYQRLVIATSSLLPLAAVGRNSPDPGCLEHVSISRSFCHMFVIRRFHDPASGVERRSLMVFSMAELAQRKDDICHMWFALSVIIAKLQEAADIGSRCSEEWEAAMTQVEERKQALQQLQAGYALNSRPEDDFQTLLTYGHVNAAMHQFLSSTLGEGGVKRMSKAVDGAVVKLAASLNTQLQPLLDTVACQLQELASLSRCTAWAQPIGLKESMVLEVERGVIAASQRCAALRGEVLRVGAAYRMFHAWLLRCVRRLNEEAPRGTRIDSLPSTHVIALRTFLHSHFRADSIGPQLGSDKPEDAVQLEAPPPHICALMDVLKAELPAFRTPLLPQIKACKRQLTASANHTANALSPHLRPFTEGLLRGVVGADGPPSGTGGGGGTGGTSPGCPVAVSMAQARNAPFDGSLHVATLQTQHGPPVVRVSTVEAVGPKVALKGEKAVDVVVDVAGLEVIDIAFYRRRELVLLVREREEVTPGRARLLLFPTLELPPDVSTSPLPPLPGETEVAAASLSEMMARGLVRDRRLTYTHAAAPLAVGASRGVAAVFAGVQRALVLDLEEDEEGPDEDAAEPQEEDEGQAQGSDLESDRD